MNIPNCVIKDQKYISSSTLEHHQSLAKRLYNSSKKIKSLDSSSQNPMNNYSKKKIFKWLFNLDLNTRINICSIYNNWFSKILFQLLTYKEYDCTIRFIPKRPYESFYKKIRPDFDEDNFDYNIYINDIVQKEKKNRIIKDEDEFKCKDNYHNFFEGVSPDNKDKHNNKNQVREKDFLKELRFYTLNEFNDTFTLSFELLNSKTKLQEYFDTFSNCKIFSENIISTKKNNNIYNFSFPNWVTEHKSFSVQQIIIICFEQIISFYYQIFLLDGVIPNFEIDSKIKEMLIMNENIENYLAKKINNDFFNKELITKEVNSEKYLKINKDNEIKSENVYVIAFDRERSQFFVDEEIKANEIENTLKQLKSEYNKNISKFVNNISFIVASSAFKTKNIIYNIIYQQIASLCRKRNIDELYMNINDDKPKNKKRRKKNKKNNTNIKKYDNNNDEEKNEINYINIDEDTKGKNENNDNNDGDKYNILNNNYNSINNEKNRNNINNNSDEDEDNYFSNDYYDKIPESIERIYGLKGEKSEKKVEQLIEMKELNKNGKEIKKDEEKEKEKEKNNSELLEEIMGISKKKKKRKRKKNIDNNINNENNLDNNKEKEEEEKNENNIKDNKDNKDNKDIKEINNNIQNIEEIKNENKLKDDKIDKLNIKDEEDKNNKKKHKEFFLFPIEHTKKKKGKKNKTNKDNNINNKELKNESDKDKENDKKKYTLTKTTISNKNENDNGNEINDIKSNNKNDLLIETKESKIEFTGINQTSKKNKIDNNNSINIIDNQNNMDYLTEFNKNQIVNPNNPIINNYIFIDQKSYKNSSSFIDNYNNKMNNPSFNNMFFQSHNPGFQNNYFPSLMGSFNFQIDYQNLPNEYYNDLSNELLSYEESVYNNLDILKKYREDSLINIKNYIENILKENNFDVQLINYGSFETKLSIEISDIDILIKFCKKNNKVNDINQQHIEYILSLLHEKIDNNKEKYQIIVVNAIYTASVPVLKIKCSLESIIPDDIKNKLKEKYIFNFEEDILHLNFDFTFLEVNDIKEEKNIPSLEIVSYIQNILNNYKEIKPIILFLKRYMSINRLNSSFHGGLSSYSLFLLVYAYFKYKYKYIFLNTLGKHLHNILDYYSNLNFGIYSINVNLSNPYVELNELHECGMMLIDPLTKLNVAKSTFRVDQIKSVLTKGVVIIRNIIYKKFIENNNYNCGNGNIYLEELFKSKNGTIILEEMNTQIIPNQVSIGKWM